MGRHRRRNNDDDGNITIAILRSGRLAASRRMRHERKRPSFETPRKVRGSSG
jgi:hypothetical protein